MGTVYESRRIHRVRSQPYLSAAAAAAIFDAHGLNARSKGIREMPPLLQIQPCVTWRLSHFGNGLYLFAAESISFPFLFNTLATIYILYLHIIC